MLAAGSRCVASLLLVVGGSAALAAPARPAGFRPAANGACVHYDRRTSALPEIGSAAELRRQLALVPRLFGTMVDRIAAASPSPGERARAAQLVASLRRVQRVLEQIRDAFLHGDQAGVDAAVRRGTGPSRAAARAARALGLPACARLAAATATGPR